MDPSYQVICLRCIIALYFCALIITNPLDFNSKCMHTFHKAEILCVLLVYFMPIKLFMPQTTKPLFK